MIFCMYIQFLYTKIGYQKICQKLVIVAKFQNDLKLRKKLKNPFLGSKSCPSHYFFLNFRPFLELGNYDQFFTYFWVPHFFMKAIYTYKKHKNCSQIECFISQKPLAPNILSSTVYIPTDILRAFVQYHCRQFLVRRQFWFIII